MPPTPLPDRVRDRLGAVVVYAGKERSNDDDRDGPPDRGDRVCGWPSRLGIGVYKVENRVAPALRYLHLVGRGEMSVADAQAAVPRRWKAETD